MWAKPLVIKVLVSTDIGAVIVIGACVLNGTFVSMLEIAIFGIGFLFVQFLILIWGVAVYGVAKQSVWAYLFPLHWLLWLALFCLYCYDVFGLRRAMFDFRP